MNPLAVKLNCTANVYDCQKGDIHRAEEVGFNMCPEDLTSNCPRFNSSHNSIPTVH